MIIVVWDLGSVIAPRVGAHRRSSSGQANYILILVIVIKKYRRLASVLDEMVYTYRIIIRINLPDNPNPIQHAPKLP